MFAGVATDANIRRMLPAYFITFHTYGSWLHGEAAGSVDPDHNVPGMPFVPPNEQLRNRDAGNLRQPSVSLDARQRGVVGRTIIELCERNGWALHAIHVRTNHVHVIVSVSRAAPPRDAQRDAHDSKRPLNTATSPERVMNAFKAWCTRRLREERLLPCASRRANSRWDEIDDVKVWSRHGSTRWINDAATLEAKIDYVLNRQGAKLPAE